MLSAAAFPSFQFHLEIWFLVLGLAFLGIYTARVIQPKAVAAGEPAITARQKICFWSGLFVMWAVTEWPMHDIAEERLYWIHMVQHSALTVIVPPLMLIAIPTWLARLIVGDGRFKRFLYFWARPVPALIVFNFLIALSHWAWIVNESIANGWLHYGVHTVLVFAALLVWMPVCGPVPELVVTPPMKIVTVFLISIIPTIPAAFLTTAEMPLYSGYDHGPRLWGFDVVNDQQVAGVVMKVVTGFYLWVIIAVIFFRWALGDRTNSRKFRGKLVVHESALDDPDHPLDTDGSEVVTYEELMRRNPADDPVRAPHRARH